MKLGALRQFLLMLFPALVMVAIFVTPFGFVVRDSFSGRDSSFTLDNYLFALTDPYVMRILGFTIYIGIITSIVCVLIAFPFSYWLVFHVSSRPAKRWIYILIFLPLFTSSVVRSFAWIILLGRNGLVGRFLPALGIVGEGKTLLYTQASVVIGLVYLSLPIMIISIASVLGDIRRSLIEASRDLGASSLVTLFKVIIPLSLPGATAGCLIVFSLSVSAYVTPTVLSGGRLTVVPGLIFQEYMLSQNVGMGGALSVILLASCLLLAIGFVSLMKLRSYPRAGT